VLNHTSDEHPWFVESSSSRENPYRGFYHWWEAEKGEPPRRQSFFDEDGSAWQYHAATDSYYLHYFSKKQPDLNWENPATRRAMYEVMHFWLKRGADGFRMDACTFISKDTTFPALTEAAYRDFPTTYAHGPHLHAYFQEMHAEVFAHYDLLTVGEAAGIGTHEVLQFVGREQRKLLSIYHFDHVNWGKRADNSNYIDPNNRRLSDLKKVFSDWDAALADDGWGTVYFSNHDQSRMVSRFGNDTTYREASAKMLFTLLLSMRATPYLYQGDELGMTNIRFKEIEAYKDINTLKNYQLLLKTGGDVAEFLQSQQEVSRDNGRTPMQWAATPNGGFTEGTPWLAVNPNYATVNVDACLADENSILHYVRRMIALRKAHPVLVYGAYVDLLPAHPQIFAYSRTMGEVRMTVMLNFSDSPTDFTLPYSLALDGEIMNNYHENAETNGAAVCLQPWQAVIVCGNG
jgi:oligo-1,6-glucosidase